MKRRKLTLRKGATILLVEFCWLYKNNTVEGFDIYYFNKRTRKLFQQENNFILGRQQRSIQALEDKYLNDFDHFKDILSDFHLCITEIGVL